MDIRGSPQAKKAGQDFDRGNTKLKVRGYGRSSRNCLQNTRRKNETRAHACATGNMAGRRANNFKSEDGTKLGTQGLGRRGGNRNRTSNWQSNRNAAIPNIPFRAYSVYSALSLYTRPKVCIFRLPSPSAPALSAALRCLHHIILAGLPAVPRLLALIALHDPQTAAAGI